MFCKRDTITVQLLSESADNKKASVQLRAPSGSPEWLLGCSWRNEVWVKLCIWMKSNRLHSEISPQIHSTPEWKKDHNQFRLSREQTNQLFMNNEYCILLLKWLLILFHKSKKIWFGGRVFAPCVKLNIQMSLATSAGGGGWAGQLKKSNCRAAFIPFFNCTSCPLTFVRSWSDKHRLSGSLHFCCTSCPDASTLKSNRGVKQSSKQPPCNILLFYLPPWLRYGEIKALPSAHPLVL